MKSTSELFHLSTRTLGVLGIEVKDDDIVQISFCKKTSRIKQASSLLAKQISHDLTAYLEGNLKQFAHPLAAAPTIFQSRLRQALLAIPYGHTKSYGELAKQLKTSPRAIGAACRANPVPVIVPCHRVVAANGIGGFSGAVAGVNIQRKQWLLELEAGSAI